MQVGKGGLCSSELVLQELISGANRQMKEHDELLVGAVASKKVDTAWQEVSQVRAEKAALAEELDNLREEKLPSWDCTLREELDRERRQGDALKDKELGHLRQVAVESLRVATDVVPALQLHLKVAEKQLLAMSWQDCNNKQISHELRAPVARLHDALYKKQLEFEEKDIALGPGTKDAKI